MRKIASEIIREKIFILTKDEIPHSTTVLIDRYIEEENIDKIFSTIAVEHNSQKIILIGKNGQMIKKIGTDARLELEKICDKKVFLDLNVKVIKNWRKNNKNLENML